MINLSIINSIGGETRDESHSWDETREPITLMPGSKHELLDDRFPYNSEKDTLYIQAHTGDVIWHKTEMSTWYTEVLYNEVLLNRFFTTRLKWSNFKASKSMKLKGIVRLISWDDTWFSAQGSIIYINWEACNGKMNKTGLLFMELTERVNHNLKITHLRQQNTQAPGLWFRKQQYLFLFLAHQEPK